jgi:hypothetical protein
MADFATGFKRKSYEQNLPLYNLMKGQVARVQLVHEPQIDFGSILQPFFVGFFQRQLIFWYSLGPCYFRLFFFQTIHSGVLFSLQCPPLPAFWKLGSWAAAKNWALF